MEKPITTQDILAEFDERFTEANPGWRETGFTGETIMKDSVYPGQLKKFITNSITQVLESLRMKELPHSKWRIDTFEDGQAYGEIDGENAVIRRLNQKIDQIIQGK